MREVSRATLVCKRGPLGAVAFPGDVPERLDAGEAGPGFPIEVFNVLGAGDGFMSGLLKGWLDGEDWPTALKYANACGAFAVSRHGCTPAYPSWEELQVLLRAGIVRKDLRNDRARTGPLGHQPARGLVGMVFAFDHRAQLEQLPGASPERIGAFKRLCLEAALKVQGGRRGYGILCDGRLGADALYAAEGRGLWIGRPVEWPGSRPLTLEPALGPDCGGLSEWPRDQVVKVLCFVIPTTTRRCGRIRRRPCCACSARHGETAGTAPGGHPLEGRPYRGGHDRADHPAISMISGSTRTGGSSSPSRPKRNGGTPCRRSSATTRAPAAVVLGLEAPEDELAASFALAARFPLVKGLRRRPHDLRPGGARLAAGRLDDDAAVETMAQNYARLCRIWDEARSGATEKAA